jgi:hypothetical protein
MVRRRSQAAAWALFLGAAALLSCAKDTTAPMLFEVAGHVRMTGYLLDADSRFVGTRVVGNPDGVLVELVYGERVVARTTTANGLYRFTGVRPGGYVARAPIVGTVGDQTRLITVATTDLMVADTLKLESTGDLALVPNPAADTCDVYYGLDAGQLTTIRIIRLDGTLVRTLVDHAVDVGLHISPWDGLDDDGHPATESYYWVTFASGSDYRAHLLFR